MSNSDTARPEFDPVDEMSEVLAKTLRANALRITSSRGGYPGHAEVDNDSGAVDAVARGLLARSVAEPSRAALASDAGSVGALDVERLARLTWEAAEDATDFEDYRQRLTLSLDAERQGERA